MSMFDAYMAKYNDIEQHQLSRLSHLREGARELYNMVQTSFRVPQLEKNLEEAWLKWADLANEHAVWTAKVRKVQKLEVDVAEL